jgi:probable HAF family extracellular repeat protein
MRMIQGVLGVFLATSVHAAPLAYTATVIPLVGYSGAVGINNLGQVAVNTEGNALLYTPGVGFSDVGSLGGSGSTARGLNDLGQVVGSSTTEVVVGFAYFHPFLYTPGAGIVDIGRGRFANNYAYDINNAGGVVFDDGFYSSATGYVSLTTSLETDSNSNATSINEHGVMVGAVAGSSTTNKHAAILALFTDPLSGMTTTYRELGTLDENLPGGEFTSSQAYDINDRGLVVGSSHAAGGGDTAVLSLGARPMISLGVLPGREQSAATSINSTDLIVGISFVGGPTHGFLYSDGIYDLNDLVTGSPQITDISVDGGPDGINDWGQIAAFGTVGGEVRALILNPVNPITPGIDISQPGVASRDTKFVAGMNYSAFTATTNPVAGSRATKVELLDGTAGVNRDVEVSFNDGSAVGAIASDVVGVTGTGKDMFVLQLSYDEGLANLSFGGEAHAYLSWLDPADRLWKNAVTGNDGGAPVHQVGAYDPTVDFVLGYFGVDTAANTVWAVLDHNSSFAIVGVPEPSMVSLELCALLAGVMLRLRRRPLR